jgi:hypothetical protein
MRALIFFVAQVVEGLRRSRRREKSRRVWASPTFYIELHSAFNTLSSLSQAKPRELVPG